LNKTETAALEARIKRQQLFEQAFKTAGYAASKVTEFPKFVYFRIQDGDQILNVKMELTHVNA